MGGCQAYQWGAQYPDMMQAIAPLCCSAHPAASKAHRATGKHAAILTQISEALTAVIELIPGRVRRLLRPTSR